ncbi:hypothetical protein WR25_08163 [Diploscapter pachys]|uniref:Uncharacterized protein n=1 Tax=Diploscapter pachys TaxID=2018661 RepID=A0A2A2K3S9_9BILA|nr:hypothetical protein WR25_08163 [Diploscapter pachys]
MYMANTVRRRGSSVVSDQQRRQTDRKARMDHRDQVELRCERLLARLVAEPPPRPERARRSAEQRQGEQGRFAYPPAARCGARLIVGEGKHRHQVDRRQRQCGGDEECGWNHAQRLHIHLEDRFLFLILFLLLLADRKDLTDRLGIVAAALGFGHHVLDVVGNTLLLFFESLGAFDQQAQFVRRDLAAAHAFLPVFHMSHPPRVARGPSDSREKDAGAGPAGGCGRILGGVGGGIARHALVHPRELFGGRFGLVARLPLVLRHAVDRLTRGRLVQPAGFLDPVRQAVAAESGQPHQVDVLRVGAMAQVADEAAERLRGDRIGQRIEFVGHGRLR